MAIVLMVFLTLVFGMLDLGIAVLRYHQLAQAARQGAREAVVHGSLADKLGTWGPGSIELTPVGTSPHPLAAAIRPSLVGFDLNEAKFEAEWLLGNDPRAPEPHRVRVTVHAPYHPMMTFIFGNPEYMLQASSTMAIAH